MFSNKQLEPSYNAPSATNSELSSSSRDSARQCRMKLLYEFNLMLF